MSSSRDSKLGLDLSCSSQYSRVSVAAAVVDVVLELLVMIAAVLRGQVLAAECLSMVVTMLHRRKIEGGKKKLSTLFSELSMNSPPRGDIDTAVTVLSMMLTPQCNFLPYNMNQILNHSHHPYCPS